MAKQLTVINQRAQKLSLPEAVTSRLKWLGIVEGRKYLSTGLTPLTEQDREIITRQIADIEGELAISDADGELKTALVAEMLMALAGGITDAKAIEAKQYAYFVGMDDIPAWAMRAALDQWYGGKVKALKVSSDEYRWPPAPGVLAIICRSIMQPYHDALEKLNTVLTVKPLDETLAELHRKGAA